MTTNKDLPVAFCFRCGVSLTPREIAFQLSGQYVRFNDRLIGEMSIFSCDNCLEAIDIFIAKKIRGADERRRSLEKEI